MTAKGDFFPQRTNDHVPNMQYAADVGDDQMALIVLPAMVAADADAILAAQSIASAGTVTTLAAGFTSDAMGKFGRNVTVVASGAATSLVTVSGRDYLGQYMSENLTLNGTTSVVGKKAFKHITAITFAATAATTINVGYGNALGLPYRTFRMQYELVNNVLAANAGTIISAVDGDQTATSGDPRGTYTPHSTLVPNGAREYKVTLFVDNTNLHGNPHYSV